MPTTYDVLLSYDISTAKSDDNVNTAVKNCMIDKEYADRYTNTASEIIYLPNTTLWKPNITSKQAKDDIVACLNEYNEKNKTKHKLERFIAIKFNDGTDTRSAILGTEHNSKSKAPTKR